MLKDIVIKETLEGMLRSSRTTSIKGINRMVMMIQIGNLQVHLEFQVVIQIQEKKPVRE